MDELTTLIDESNFILIACVIDKPALKERGEVAVDNPYHYALRYGLEQLVCFIEEKGQVDRDTHAVVECRGKKEDRDLELEFRRICDGANGLNREHVGEGYEGVGLKRLPD